MKKIFFCLFFFSLNAISSGEIDFGVSKNYQEIWTKLGKNEEIALKILFNTLSQSETGKKLLKLTAAKGREQGKTLTDIIFPGDSSVTDTTLLRRFSAHDPSVVAYETRSKVYINRHLNLVDAMMDLAHELTHYLYREPFNPYRPQFGLKLFVQSTIEGRGGEVDAYLLECQVFNEIFKKFDSASGRCSLVLDQEGKLSKQKGIQEFYKVGNYFDDFIKDLSREGLSKEDFNEIRNETPSFISSAYSLPYPLAAIREYYTVMGKACQNDKKRMALLEQVQHSLISARSPASLKKDSFLELKQNLSDRCPSHLF